MRTFKIILLLLLFSTSLLMSQPARPEKLKRADCFFGVHFDLHASEDITDAGKTLTPEMIDTFLLKVRPDFIQIDCKGHPGIASYPTKVGYHVRGFEKDPLKLFREVTAKNNVALFLHYSGVWDSKVATEYPYWAVVNSNGERSKTKVSFFSPYLNTFMIPQLKELSDYGVDGMWVDGDCWAVEPDYGEASLARFTAETGIKEIPRKSGDRYYPEFIEYTRSLFREHMTRYVNAIHQYNPSFQITSNWAYSSIMPEKATVAVDYLSGDVTPQNGVYRSAFEARCLAPQGKPWDLMAWGFSWDGGEMPMNIKSAIQLEQEAAEIISMGGGVQFYFQQNRDLSIKPWLAGDLSEIAAFCRARQPFCHKAKAVPQIALLFPASSYQKNAERPYSNPTTDLQGALYMLLDGQNAVEILMEHTLTGNMDKYGLIVIPECDYLDSSLREELRQYVSNGGRLLLLGPKVAGLFRDDLGIKSIEDITAAESFIESRGRISAIRTETAHVELQPDAVPTSMFYNSSDFTDKSTMICSSSRPLGKGKIAAIYFNAGNSYSRYKMPVLRDFTNDIVNDLFPGPMVEVSGSHLVHVAVNKLNDRVYVNLINTAGEHANTSVIGYDQIPSLKDLDVSIKTGTKPSKILLQPGAIRLKYEFSNGVAKVRVKELPLHSIIEVID